MDDQTNKTNHLVNDHIDMVYVLSVKTFTDRIAHIKTLMQQHDIPFEFIFEHDIPDMSSELLAQTFSSACKLTMAQKSLVLKHIQAWKNACLNQFKHVLVFEDDVILNKNFKLYFDKVVNAINQLPAGHLVFLGGADAKVPAHFLLSNETLVALPLATAEAYISDLTAMQRRVDWLNTHQVSMPADHLICHIDQHTQTAHYWSRRPMAEQGSVTGIFNSHLDSHRQKHSKLFNVLRYRWNKFQRHILRRWVAKLRQQFQ
jgi:glycosyl transferase family 25